jgi:pimeloyl-ACP methyl ester carboxylesterase
VAQDPATLASLLRSAGQGAMLPVWDRLGEIRCPSLHIAGELDEPYVDAARRIAELVTDGRVGVVPHAGHAAHLERPDEVARLVLEFLDANVGERARR